MTGFRKLPEFPDARLKQFASINETELALVSGLAGPPFQVGARQVIRHDGAPVDSIYLLHDGWVGSSILRSDGSRAIVKIHVGGDFMGVPSLALTRTAETLCTFTPAVVSRLPVSAFRAIFTSAPRLAAVLFLATQLERVTLSERVVSIGRSPARSRFAALLLHLRDRLGTGQAGGVDSIPLPLTQADLGDVLGLTSVHINRVIRLLEQDHLISRHGQHFRLIDLPGLRRAAGAAQHQLAASPDWLP